MSVTRLLCDGCGFPICYCKCKPPVAQAGRDEGHTCENKYEMMRSWVKAVVDQADAQYKCGDKTCTISKGMIESMRKDISATPKQPAPVKHFDCEKCEHEHGTHQPPCNSCCHWVYGERKNYTPQTPSKPNLDFKQAWLEVVRMCLDLGMPITYAQSSRVSVCAFIRELHRRAGERDRILAAIKDDSLAERVPCNYATETFRSVAIAAYRSALLEHIEKGTP